VSIAETKAPPLDIVMGRTPKGSAGNLAQITKALLMEVLDNLGYKGPWHAAFHHHKEQKNDTKFQFVRRQGHQITVRTKPADVFSCYQIILTPPRIPVYDLAKVEKDMHRVHPTKLTVAPEVSIPETASIPEPRLSEKTVAGFQLVKGELDEVEREVAERLHESDIGGSIIQQHLDTALNAPSRPLSRKEKKALYAAAETVKELTVSEKDMAGGEKIKAHIRAEGRYVGPTRLRSAKAFLFMSLSQGPAPKEYLMELGNRRGHSPQAIMVAAEDAGYLKKSFHGHEFWSCPRPEPEPVVVPEPIIEAPKPQFKHVSDTAKMPLAINPKLVTRTLNTDAYVIVRALSALMKSIIRQTWVGYDAISKITLSKEDVWQWLEEWLDLDKLIEAHHYNNLNSVLRLIIKGLCDFGWIERVGHSWHLTKQATREFRITESGIEIYKRINGDPGQYIAQEGDIPAAVLSARHSRTIARITANDDDEGIGPEDIIVPVPDVPEDIVPVPDVANHQEFMANIRAKQAELQALIDEHDTLTTAIADYDPLINELLRDIQSQEDAIAGIQHLIEELTTKLTSATERLKQYEEKRTADLVDLEKWRIEKEAETSKLEEIKDKIKAAAL